MEKVKQMKHHVSNISSVPALLGKNNDIVTRSAQSVFLSLASPSASVSLLIDYTVIMFS